MNTKKNINIINFYKQKINHFFLKKIMKFVSVLLPAFSFKGNITNIVIYTEKIFFIMIINLYIIIKFFQKEKNLQ